MKLNTLVGIIILGILAIVYFSLDSASSVCSVTWSGSTDEAMLTQVKRDIEAAKGTCPKLKVEFRSSGGPVYTVMEITRTIRNARATGLDIEIHGGSVIISGGTFVLGAGSPGMRYIYRNSAVLIHGLQKGSWLSQSCVDWVDLPSTEEEKLDNTFIMQAAQDYADSSGQSIATTKSWLRCKNAQAGDGQLLITLGLADHVEN